MKLGRPKIEDSEKKERITGVRLREDERQILEKAASSQGKTLSAWIRSSLLENAESINEQQPELPFFESNLPRVLSVDDIYDNVTQELLAIIEEDRRIERKVARIDRKELGEYFCMWANTAPNGGLIAVGVSNDGKLEGLSGASGDAINEQI